MFRGGTLGVVLDVVNEDSPSSSPAGGASAEKAAMKSVPASGSPGEVSQPGRRARTSEMPVEWKEHLRKGLPVPSSLPPIERGSRVLTMGSCFANEVRSALIDDGVDVLPRFESKVSERFLWYTPMSLLQEVRLAFGLFRRDERDLWEHLVVPARPRGSRRWQDPYRRLVFADTREELVRTIGEQDRTIREGFEQAGHFLFTLGLIEAWRLPTGNWACLEPFPLDPAKAELHVLGVGECTAAIREIVRILSERRPGASITLTVSPVPLRLTYREGIDVAVANSESKSTLRAAVGEVCRQDPRVHYFPSYEIVTALGSRAFEQDGRHVRHEVVATALDWFLRRKRRPLILYSKRRAKVALLTLVYWEGMFWASAETFVSEEAACAPGIGVLWLAYLFVAWELAHWSVMHRSSLV